MPEEDERCSAIQVTNVAPGSTRDQIKTLFSCIGKIRDIRMYPTDDSMELAMPKICYIKFYDCEDADVSLHLTNTVFIDRAIIVTPLPDGQFPDEATTLANLATPGFTGVPPQPTKAEELEHTVYAANIDLTAAQIPTILMEFFGHAGEVKYIRLAGDASAETRGAFVEYTDRSSAMRALALSGTPLGGQPVHVQPATTTIIKPTIGGIVASSREVAEAMKTVDEAQALIEAAANGGRGSSHSKSKSSRSHSHRSKSRSPRRSRSRHSRHRSSHSRKHSHSNRESHHSSHRQSRSRSRKRHTSSSRDSKHKHRSSRHDRSHSSSVKRRSSKDRASSRRSRSRSAHSTKLGDNHRSRRSKDETEIYTKDSGASRSTRGCEARNKSAERSSSHRSRPGHSHDDSTSAMNQCHDRSREDDRTHGRGDLMPRQGSRSGDVDREHRRTEEYEQQEMEDKKRDKRNLRRGSRDEEHSSHYQEDEELYNENNRQLRKDDGGSNGRYLDYERRGRRESQERY